MSADRAITRYLGQVADDPTVTRLISLAGVWAPLGSSQDPEAVPESPWDWVSGAAGLEFGFCRRSYRQGLSSSGASSPWELAQVYFHDLRPETVASLPVDVPCGITAALDRAAVRLRALHAGCNAARHGTRDAFEIGAATVTVGYGPEGRAANVRVASALRPWAWKAEGSTGVTWESMEALLGVPWHDARVRALIGRLHGDGELRDLVRPHGADLHETCGVELLFGGDRSGAVRGGRRFVAFRLFADRVHDACGWPGALPSGITFADGPSEVEAKLAQSPRVRQATGLASYAVWSGVRSDLHVQYCDVENLVRVVTVMAHGFFQSPGALSPVAASGPRGPA